MDVPQPARPFLDVGLEVVGGAVEPGVSRRLLGELGLEEGGRWPDAVGRGGLPHAPVQCRRARQEARLHEVGHDRDIGPRPRSRSLRPYARCGRCPGRCPTGNARSRRCAGALRRGSLCPSRSRRRHRSRGAARRARSRPPPARRNAPDRVPPRATQTGGSDRSARRAGRPARRSQPPCRTLASSARARARVPRGRPRPAGLPSGSRPPNASGRRAPGPARLMGCHGFRYAHRVAGSRPRNPRR